MVFSGFAIGLFRFPFRWVGGGGGGANIFALTGGNPDPKTPRNPKRNKTYRPGADCLRIPIADLYGPTQKYRFAQTMEIRRRPIHLGIIQSSRAEKVATADDSGTDHTSEFYISVCFSSRNYF